MKGKLFRRGRNCKDSFYGIFDLTKKERFHLYSVGGEIFKAFWGEFQ